MTLRPSELKLRQDVADAYHLCVQYGWDDLIYGHISVRLPEQPDCYLINPFGLLFSEITPDNLLKVNIDGQIICDNVQGSKYNPAGEHLHHTIYKHRSDVNSVVHLHTKHGVALSALKEGLLPLSQHACHFYGQVAYHDYEGIIIDKTEQETLLRDLGDKNIMVLSNHGLLTAGKTLQEAFCTMYMLEKAAAFQMAILASGQELTIPPKEVCEKVAQQANSVRTYDLEWGAMIRSLYSAKTEVTDVPFWEKNRSIRSM